MSLPFSLDIWMQAQEKTIRSCTGCKYWDPDRYECTSHECEGEQDDDD